MKLTMEQARKMMEKNGGWLDLRGTQITDLPDNLTVGGSLDLSNTQITALPDNLTVGGGLYLSSTQITAEQSKKARRLKDGDCVPGKYIYCDGILTHIRKTHHVDGYTLYVGKIKNKNVVSDGELYAHCETFREGIADIAFKRAKDRGAEQYRGMSLDTVLPLAEAKTMYRIITGACSAGTEAFAESLGDKLQESYTIREMLEVTKGQYGAQAFAEFWEDGGK